MLLFFDTETTGLPNWHKPSDDPSQPYIVELAAVLTDDDGKRVSSFSSLVKPEGWTIEPGEAADVHGITTEMCQAGGVGIAVLWLMFDGLMRRADKIVAHSLNFDKRMLRIALKRMGMTGTMDTLKQHAGACTMHMARSAYGADKAKLDDIYTHLFGKAPFETHRAGVDALHCRDIYLKLMEGKPDGQ